MSVLTKNIYELVFFLLTYVFNFKTVKKRSQKVLDNNIRKLAKFKKLTSVYIFLIQTPTICMVPKGEEKISIEFVKRSPRPFSFLHSICFAFFS